jgi:hypothetical protein
MVTYEELHDQNHKITELTNVLRYLLADRSLCDSEITCELFFRYVDAVKHHLEVADSQIYSKLLVSSDANARSAADNFLGGSKEIKRIFASYLKGWCRQRDQQLVIRDHDRFQDATEEMFNMVLDRIQSETERLYPLMREVSGDDVRVSA